jgi:hypothetical protein
MTLQSFPNPSAILPMNPDLHLRMSFSREPREASSLDLLSVSLNSNNPSETISNSSLWDCQVSIRWKVLPAFPQWGNVGPAAHLQPYHISALQVQQTPTQLIHCQGVWTSLKGSQDGGGGDVAMARPDASNGGGARCDDVGAACGGGVSAQEEVAPGAMAMAHFRQPVCPSWPALQEPAEAGCQARGAHVHPTW